jgi:hypothetical protein
MDAPVAAAKHVSPGNLSHVSAEEHRLLSHKRHHVDQGWPPQTSPGQGRFRGGGDEAKYRLIDEDTVH